jgi:hypothetical protein
MSIALHKLDPRYSIYLGGFDARGCSASITAATASSFKVTGNFAALTDFATLYILDANDFFGHLFTSKYLPDFNMTGVVLDFDLAITGGFYPGSKKYPSVPWNALSYITESGTASSVALDITSTTGLAYATASFTVATTLAPITSDRVQLIYLGNVIFDVIVGGVYNGVTVTTVNQVAAALAYLINSATSASTPLTATSTGGTLTVTCTQPGQDGNTIELTCLYKTVTTQLYPTGSAGSPPASGLPGKLTGGTDPSTFHVHIDFSALGLTSLRQAWLTLAPSLPINSAAGDYTLQAFTNKTFSYEFSNWTVTDPDTHTPLSIAGPGSVTVGSRDAWASYTTGPWVVTPGDYYQGFSNVATAANQSVTIQYSCQSEHNLYLGTSLYVDRGILLVTLDGVAQSNVDMYLDVSSPTVTRVLLASSVAAGNHTVALTVDSSHNADSTGYNAYFDYLQAAVPSNVEPPAILYDTINPAWDFDTSQTYMIPPARALFISQQMGFAGDLDFYAGVFFALKRTRYGGSFHACTITLSGTLATNDTIWISVGGPTGHGTLISGATSEGGNPTGSTLSPWNLATVFGAEAQPADTLTTMAQRIVDAINALFIGVRAAPTATAGQLTITVLSPIDGFSLDVSKSSGSTVTLAVSGDIGNTSGGGGNEGIWQVDSTQTSPLNQAFQDYLTDLSTVITAAGQTVTVAFSQELLAPPDANTSSGAWIQRFNDGPPGTTVLTATEFGTWGVGYVEGVSSGTVHETAHGYSVGYVLSDGTNFYTVATVPDADHYTLVSGVPAVGAQITAQLQTSQCTFNPATMTAYMTYVYIQAAALMVAAGIATPWLQFGEIGWWFFAGGTGPSMAYYDAYTSAEATSVLGRPLATFTSPSSDESVNGYADANFLQNLVYQHMHAIALAVVAATPAALFEWLFPDDVNFFEAYQNTTYPYSIGGALNRYVNTPGLYLSPGSDISRFKVEALAWGTSYRTIDNVLLTLSFAADNAWPLADVRYLIPWDNGGCPWVNEYGQALDFTIPGLGFWAIDHAILFSWMTQPLGY